MFVFVLGQPLDDTAREAYSIQAPDPAFISLLRGLAKLSIFQCLVPKMLPLSSLTYTKYSLRLPTQMSLHCCRHLHVTPLTLGSLTFVIFLGLCSHAIFSGSLCSLTSKVPSCMPTKCHCQKIPTYLSTFPRLGAQ